MLGIGNFLGSRRGKIIMGYVYGWGAAVVMVGALFKLQHWPYSGYFLTAGLLTEAFIFFLSAFEKPFEVPDWGKVYPELRADYDGEVVQTSVRRQSQGATFEELLSNSELSPELLGRLGEGLANLSNTAQGIQDISSATVATDGYVKNIQTASMSIGTLAENNNKANEQITNAVNNLVQSYNSASKTYEEATGSIQNNILSVGQSSKEYSDNLKKLNQSLMSVSDGLNQQIKGSEEHFKALHHYSDDIKRMNELLSQSTSELAKYKENAQQLNKNLEELNAVYGNMLNAMKISK